jgi:hypothetical protein
MRLSSSPLPRFFAIAAVALIALTLAWRPVAGTLAAPAAWLAATTMRTLFPDWVRSAKGGAGRLEVETRLTVRPTPQQMADAKRAGQEVPEGAVAEVVLETDPSLPGYGLPILLALLLAARGKRLILRALLGAACLVPFQAYCLVTELLKQAAITSGAAAQTGFSALQINLIAYAYQLGALLVPTLAPILIWVWLDRAFFAAVVIEGWLERTQAERTQAERTSSEQ